MRILYFIAFLTIISCTGSDDPGCFVSDVDFTNLEAAYSCENTKNTVDIALDNTFTRIDSQAEYDAQVTGDCNVQIDFTTYTLIIGKQGLASGNISIGYDFINDCATNTYTLDVTFNQDASAVAPNLTYHILSPKLDSDAIIVVNTIIN